MSGHKDVELEQDMPTFAECFCADGAGFEPGSQAGSHLHPQKVYQCLGCEHCGGVMPHLIFDNWDGEGDAG